MKALQGSEGPAPLGRRCYAGLGWRSASRAAATWRSSSQRIVGDELASARKALADEGPDQDAIHEARKSVKKARAVLRLLRAPLDDDYDEADDQLRKVAHALSSLRDADATLDVLERLHAEHPTAVTPIVVRTVRRGLQGRKRRTQGSAETVVAWARGMLDRAKGRIPARIGRVARFPERARGCRSRIPGGARGHARLRGG